jgi:hypothetical protein
MRVIRARFAMKIDRRIAGIVRWRRGRRVVLAEALQTRPGFQQGPVNREMLVGQQVRAPRLIDHGIEERRGDVAGQQPVEFLLKVVGDQIASSIPNPTNQRNRTL